MYISLVLIPFLCVIILNFLPRSFREKIAFWPGLFLSAFQACIVIFPAVYAWSSRIDIFGAVLKFNFFVDNLGLVMLLCIGIVLFASLIVARHTIRDEEERFNFANLSLILLSGMNGVVMVNDIFSLYVFLEITAVASFILIAFDQDIFALEGAFKYVVFSTLASCLILCSIALLLFVSGNTGFNALKLALIASPNKHFIMFGIAVFICSFFIKSGLMPFHGWLPDAYSTAPAPVSVLLAGIVTKVVGVYALMRIASSLFIFNHAMNQMLLLVGTVSILLGALAALGQSDFKRLLSFSSISQVGYIILGVGCGTALGFAGAAFHLFNHAIFKSLLFVNAAAVEAQTGSRDMDKMEGLAARMPKTCVTSVIGSLSAAGIPPFSGFWSKLIIIAALWIAGHHTFAIIACLASVITLGYFLSLQRRVFFGKIKEEFKNIKEAPFGLTFPAIMLSAITVGAGLIFPFIWKVILARLGS